MTRHTFALSSELRRLTPDQRDLVTHVIIDDGEWSEAQITEYINQWMGILPDPPTNDDWTRA